MSVQTPTGCAPCGCRRLPLHPFYEAGFVKGDIAIFVGCSCAWVRLAAPRKGLLQLSIQAVAAPERVLHRDEPTPRAYLSSCNRRTPTLANSPCAGTTGWTGRSVLINSLPRATRACRGSSGRIASPCACGSILVRLTSLSYRVRHRAKGRFGLRPDGGVFVRRPSASRSLVRSLVGPAPCPSTWPIASPTAVAPPPRSRSSHARASHA